MENTLKIIKNQYGVNLLSDPEKFLSYFADLKPGDTKTLRRLKFFFQSGVAGIISSNIGSPEFAFQKAVAKDTEKAYNWLRKVAQNESDSALFVMAVLSYEKQSPEAFSYAKKACELKSENAPVVLGLCYLQGIGTAINYGMAKKCFQEVIESSRGSNLSTAYYYYYYLALMYIDGLGCERNINVANQYMQSAYKLGHPLAKDYIEGTK